MRILVIVAHPDPHSFNHAIAQAVVELLEEGGHLVWYHDLYAERFDPLLSAPEFPKDASLPNEIRHHCMQLQEAQGIVIVHPNWWGQPPAILKGWVDRVVRPGVAYEFLEGDQGEGIPIGLLKAKVALVLNTSNTAPDRERQVFGDPLERLWRDCIFAFCGVHDVYRRMFQTVVTSSDAERQEWLDEIRQVVLEKFCRH